MKKILIACALAFCTHLFIPTMSTVDAQINRNTLDVFANEKQADLYRTETSGLQDYTPSIRYGENKFRGILFVVQDFLYGVLIPISIILTVWAGMQLIFSRGDEETFNQKKTQFLGIFSGFAVLLLSKVMVDDVFFGIKRDTTLWQRMGDYVGLGGDRENREIIDAGQIFDINDSAQFAQEGFKQMEGIWNYMISFAVVVGVAMVIFLAYKMVMSVDEEEISKAKKSIIYIIVGMAVFVSGRRIIGLFRGESSSRLGLEGLWNRGNLTVPDHSATISFFIDWINFALSFLGIIAIVALIYGGIRLIANFGGDDAAAQEAKKIVIAAVAAIVVVVSAWTIMYYFVAI